jgi:hypothetical protein
MKLGERLFYILQSIETEDQRRQREEKEEKERKAYYLRQDRLRLIKDIKGDISLYINHNKIPLYKISSYENYSWVLDCYRRFLVVDNGDLWRDFLVWLDQEDLKLKINEEHDDMGIQSWIVLTVEPLCR